MKVKSKNFTADGTNRVSALKRLSGPTSTNKSVHQRLSAPTTPVVTDARQLLSNRNKPVFDARQLLSRQSSKTKNTSLVVRRDIEPEDEEEEEEDNDQGPVVLQRSNNGRLTAATIPKKNPFVSTEPISFTKTISNTSYSRQSQNSTSASSLSDQKVVISFANDQYRKRARSPSPSPPPVIRRLNNASIQTATASSRLANRGALDEPPKKQQSLSMTSKGSLKQIAASTRPKQVSSANSDAATILITNLQSSVTEDDVIELFGEIGPIKEIKTLSLGCVQVVYSREEYAKKAVDNYHNRLLDGHLMYVSLQQPPSYSTKSSKTASSSSSNTDNESSNKYTIDPSFIRQALFNPSASTSKPVQFQVKL